jgi:hypothetical protein
MSETESNVLSFSGGAAKRVSAELRELLRVYDRLISLLRETDNDGLDGLADGMVMSVMRCREALAADCDDAATLRIKHELQSDLREMPRTLRSLLPGLGPRLGESIEHRLGIQFSSY